MFIQRHLVRVWGSSEVGSELHAGCLCLHVEGTFIDLKKVHAISQSVSSIAWANPNFTDFFIPVLLEQALSIYIWTIFTLLSGCPFSCPHQHFFFSCPHFQKVVFYLKHSCVYSTDICWEFITCQTLLDTDSDLSNWVFF